MKHPVKFLSSFKSNFISSISLSYKSKASSKASSPHSATLSFHFQMRVFSPFFTVIQQRSTSSSSSSCHFYPTFYLSFSNPFQKAVSTQNVTKISQPYVYLFHVLLRVKEQRNILHEIIKRKAQLHRNNFLLSLSYRKMMFMIIGKVQKIEAIIAIMTMMMLSQPSGSISE